MIESANVSINELHSRLNHMPYLAIRQLARSGSLAGLPKIIAGTSQEEFCEDCVNGKLTRAPHTKPATRTDRPLFRVFSDIHGPLPVYSRHGHVYWVSFIDDYSRFPAVYFVTKKSDVYDAFCKYKAWAENATGHRIGILRDDKGGEYVGKEFDSFLSEAGIRCQIRFQSGVERSETERSVSAEWKRSCGRRIFYSNERLSRP